MVTAKGAFQMERKLFESISPEAIRTGDIRGDDEVYWKAFIAVMDLREYLEEKEKNEKKNN